MRICGSARCHFYIAKSCILEDMIFGSLEGPVKTCIICTCEIVQYHRNRLTLRHCLQTLGPQRPPPFAHFACLLCAHARATVQYSILQYLMYRVRISTQMKRGIVFPLHRVLNLAGFGSVFRPMLYLFSTSRTSPSLISSSPTIPDT